MWGKSNESNTASGNTTQDNAKRNNASPKATGAMMLLKSMGFDPQEFMDGINDARAEYEAAKQGAIHAAQHFNARLDAIERDNEQRFDRLEVMFRLVMSCLEVTTRPDETKQNLFTCEACGTNFSSIVESLQHSETCTGG